MLLGGTGGAKPDGAGKHVPRTLDNGRGKSNRGVDINLNKLGGAAIVWHLYAFRVWMIRAVHFSGADGAARGLRCGSCAGL